MRPVADSGCGGGCDAKGSDPVRKVVVRISAIGGGLVAILLAGGANWARR
jgi:hypothetical protein